MYWFGVLTGAYISMIVAPTHWWQPLAWVAIALVIDTGVQLLTRNLRRRRARKWWVAEVKRRDNAHRYFNGYTTIGGDK